MKKALIVSSCIAMVFVLIASQAVQATSTTFGFKKGDKFVWKWTFENLNPDNSVINTTIRYRMLNITNVVNATNYVNVTFGMPYTNQTEYETHGNISSKWNSTTAQFTMSIPDNNETEAYQGFFNVVGTSLTTLTGMNAKDRWNTIMLMNFWPVSEFFAFMFALAFSLAFNSSLIHSNTTSVSSALTNSITTDLTASFSSWSSGHWSNTSISVSSNFTYASPSNILTSLSARVTFTTVKWGVSSYQTTTARSHEVYSIVYPASLVPSGVPGYDSLILAISIFAASAILIQRSRAVRKLQ